MVPRDCHRAGRLSTHFFPYGKKWRGLGATEAPRGISITMPSRLGRTTSPLNYPSVKLTALGLLASMGLLQIGCAHGGLAGQQPSTLAETARPSVPLGAQPPPATTVRRMGCVARGALPDPSCTPGAVMTIDLEVICHQSTRRLSA